MAKYNNTKIRVDGRLFDSKAERGQGMTTKQAREQVKPRIGDLIRDNMELCGLTARDLIKELDIERAHLSAWLAGRYLPSLPTALAMARLFGVTVEQLALGDEEQWPEVEG